MTRGGRAVLGKSDVESQSFYLNLAGTLVDVTVRYTPPRTLGRNQWPLALVEIEVSNMAACLSDLDITAAHISETFGSSTGPRAALKLPRWEVKQWFLRLMWYPTLPGRS